VGESMITILLRLEGPLQSWGTQGRFGIRDTEREPSKSGVMGLLGAALGVVRSDVATLAVLRSSSFGVRVDREGALMRDYHTVGGGRFGGKVHGIGGVNGKVALTERYYLQDASFLAAVGTEDRDLADRLVGALKAPHWPLFLGRRSCVPSEPVFEGTFEGTVGDALARHPFPERLPVPPERRVRLVADALSPLEGTPRQDEPLSFALYAREHGVRYVSTTFITLPSENNRAPDSASPEPAQS
jgi:CRISPR system Cascade subunit CasD